MFIPSRFVHFTDDDMLQESGIYTGQLMILEVKKADGTWPRDTYTQGTMVCTYILYIHIHTLHVERTYVHTCVHTCTHTLHYMLNVHNMYVHTHTVQIHIVCTYMHILCTYTHYTCSHYILHMVHLCTICNI